MKRSKSIRHVLQRELVNELSTKVISGEYDIDDTILVDADKKTKKLVFKKKGVKKTDKD